MAKKIELHIEMDDLGNVSVTGPNLNGVLNKALCYSLLEVAKDVVRENAAQGNLDKIVSVPASAVSHIRGM